MTSQLVLCYEGLNGSRLDGSPHCTECFVPRAGNGAAGASASGWAVAQCPSPRQPGGPLL